MSLRTLNTAQAISDALLPAAAALRSQAAGLAQAQAAAIDGLGLVEAVAVKAAEVHVPRSAGLDLLAHRVGGARRLQLQRTNQTKGDEGVLSADCDQQRRRNQLSCAPAICSTRTGQLSLPAVSLSFLHQLP